MTSPLRLQEILHVAGPPPCVGSATSVSAAGDMISAAAMDEITTPTMVFSLLDMVAESGASVGASVGAGVGFDDPGRVSLLADAR